MSITDWPVEQRPREKLIRLGARTLTDAELLAVFLRVGVKGKSAVELANHILGRFGNLQNLFSTPIESFLTIHGIGPAKFALLQAVLELARRTLEVELKQGIDLNSSPKVKKYLQLLIGKKPFESFAVLFLDVKLQLIECEELFRGTLTTTRVYPREVLKRALHHNAASVILAHNHPSGEIEPSKADIDLTKELQEVLSLVEINVLDHMVVAGNRTYSFAEHGIL